MGKPSCDALPGLMRVLCRDADCLSICRPQYSACATKTVFAHCGWLALTFLCIRFTSSSGIPCIFWDHIQTWGEEVKGMITQLVQVSLRVAGMSCRPDVQ